MRAFVLVAVSLSVIAFILDELRVLTGIPVTLLDILFFPTTAFFDVYILWFVFVEKRLMNNASAIVVYTMWKKIGLLTLAIGMGLSGYFIMQDGMGNPLKYHSSARGAVHGYTMISAGLLFLFGGIFSTWKMTRVILLK